MLHCRQPSNAPGTFFLNKRMDQNVDPNRELRCRPAFEPQTTWPEMRSTIRCVCSSCLTLLAFSDTCSRRLFGRRAVFVFFFEQWPKTGAPGRFLARNGWAEVRRQQTLNLGSRDWPTPPSTRFRSYTDRDLPILATLVNSRPVLATFGAFCCSSPVYSI